MKENLMKRPLITQRRLPIVIAVTLVGVVVVLGLVAYLLQPRDPNDGQYRVSTRDFSVVMPEGTKNESSSRTNNNIYVTLEKPYGELRVSISRSDTRVIQVSQRGEVSTSSVTVDGVATTQSNIDYSSIIKGSSPRLQIRYEVSVSKVPKPSEDRYTTFTAKAMSTRALTDDEKSGIKADVQAMLDTLRIK